MLREQFIATSRLVQTKASRLGWRVLVWLLGGMGIITLLLPQDMRSTPVLESPWLTLLYLSFWGGSSAFLFLALNSINRRHGVACPSCGKNLHSNPSIVIASGNCGYCGTQVLELQASFEAPPPHGSDSVLH